MAKFRLAFGESAARVSTNETPRACRTPSVLHFPFQPPYLLMINRIRLAWLSLGLMALPIAARGNPNPTVDCNCLKNLPALQTYCPGIVPNLAILGTNCFSTNVDITMFGYYTQAPPPGTWVGLGTNSIQLTIFDT